MEICDIVEIPVVCQIQVVRSCRELGCQRVYLLHAWHDTVRFPEFAHYVLCIFVVKLVLVQRTSYLEIRESLLLGRLQKLYRHGFAVFILHHVMICLHDACKLVEEPLVYLREVMYLIHCISGTHSLGYHENTVIGRLFQGFIYVIHLQFLVSDETVRALPYHAQSLLDGLLEAPANGHDFAHALHAGTDLSGNAMELRKIPARNLADNIVDGRLEECRRILGHGILQVEQAVPESEFRSHECQRDGHSPR